MRDEHTRYLGTLGVLADCSPYVPEEVREQIIMAMRDAVKANPLLRYRRILDRCEVEVVFDNPPAAKPSTAGTGKCQNCGDVLAPGVLCFCGPHGPGTRPPKVLRKKSSRKLGRP